MRSNRPQNLALVLVAALCFQRTNSCAQIPRINTFYPMGARAGTTVEVEVRGGSLEGAQKLILRDKGLSATLTPGDAKVDETNKPIWEAKCGGCHELRSPANRSMTPAQWAATVERMVKLRSAPLSPDESAKVTLYLQSAARAGRVMAQIAVAPDTLPGIYEIRVVTARGVSSPYWFEVGGLPEIVGVSGPREQAQKVTMPCVANGCFANSGERHYFKFTAAKDERFVFNLKSFRYNESNQFFFSPDLRLYDPSGKEIAENHGYFDIDPLIDWTCPAPGEYVLEVRDLLGRPNPASVYRLTLGRFPYDTAISPLAAQAGATVEAKVEGKIVEGLSFKLTAPSETGVVRIGTPAGPHQILVTPYPVVKRATPAAAGMAPAVLPAAFTGAFGKAGEPDIFPVQGNGTFEFEGYANRASSTVALAVALLKSDGSEVAKFDGDGRMIAKLEAGQTYQLRVANANGTAGANMVYAIEARPARPGLECVVRPDNVTIRPGVGAPVLVILNRRDGVDGDVTITAEGLPEGVTAKPLSMPPDQNVAWLQLDAAPNAAPLEKPVRVYASAKGPLGEVKVNAIPQEEYRLNNDPRYRSWSDLMVVVRGQADFIAEFLDSKNPIRVHPRKGYPIKVRLKRRDGFKANVTVSLAGLPSGWTADPQGTEGNEVTLTVRPDGNDPNPFLKRDEKWTPMRATLIAQSDDFQFAFGSIPVLKALVITDKDD